MTNQSRKEQNEKLAREIGNRINKLREQNNMSVEQLSECLGGMVSEQAIYKWERGASIPMVDNLIALSKIFNVSMDYIVRGNHGEDESPLLPFYRKSFLLQTPLFAMK